MTSMGECNRCGKRFEVREGALSLDVFTATESRDFAEEASERIDLCPKCAEEFWDAVRKRR